jgi:shikimate dehydrogenase
MRRLDQSTRLTGIFGYPLKHTLSPAMQNAGYAILNLNFVYLAFEVEPSCLKKAIESIRTLNMRGVNITVPYKEISIPYLDKLDPFARKVGSVNTIINENGTLTGYNTDAPGFLRDISEKVSNLRNKKALVVGAGGSGRAVTSALAAAKVRQLFIVDEDDGRATRLAAGLPGSETLSKRTWKQKIKEVDILINATPIGMKPGKPIIEKDFLHKGLFVYDVVYNRKTELLSAADKAGIKSSGGLGMLLHQGTIAFELFTGKTAPIEVMNKALTSAISGK